MQSDEKICPETRKRVWCAKFPMVPSLSFRLWGNEELINWITTRGVSAVPGMLLKSGEGKG